MTLQITQMAPLLLALACLLVLVACGNGGSNGAARRPTAYFFLGGSPGTYSSARSAQLRTSSAFMRQSPGTTT